MSWLPSVSTKVKGLNDLPVQLSTKFKLKTQLPGRAMVSSLSGRDRP
jgi:hypothetical protein